MELSDIINLVIGLGAGGITTKLVDRLLDRRKGRLEQEQTAWEQRDAWARRSRRLEESLHEHRTRWHQEAGKRFDDMPEWPGRDA